MISSGTFLLAHVAIVVAILVAVAVAERRDRRSWRAWHRGVRTRHLSGEEMLRRLRKAERR